MSLLFHNNTVSLYDNWYESHASLLRAVCLELGHSDKINELMEKFVGEKMKMKAKKNKNLPKKPKSAYFFYCDDKRPALLDKAKKKGGKINIGTIAKELGEIIVQNFPNTVYAKRTAERFSIPMVQDSSAQPSEYDTFRKLYNNFEMGAEVGLDSLFSWGISARNSILGEQAYRIGLTHYIENITMDSLYQQDQARWLTEKERWVTGQANLLAFKDSIEISLEDSLLDPMEEEELAALLDSNLVEPVWYDLFPYTGLNWDIARNYLAIYDSVFMNPVKNPDLMRLKQELTPPENPYAIAVDSSLNDSLEVHGFLADSLQPDSLSMDSFSNDSLTQVSDLANSVEEGSTIDDYQSCAALDSTPSFRGGIQALLSSISYPEGVIISPVSYRFFINERGIIDRFETVDSASNAELSPDLVEAINARLASEVAFEPTIINGRSIRLVCEIVIDPSELE